MSAQTVADVLVDTFDRVAEWFQLTIRVRRGYLYAFVILVFLAGFGLGVMMASDAAPVVP